MSKYWFTSDAASAPGISFHGQNTALAETS